MRMWMVEPAVMCRQHLSGEHVELHMLASSLDKPLRRPSIKGLIVKGMLQPQHLKARHDELAAEMEARGWNHDSPLDHPHDPPFGAVDAGASLRELLRRCHDCRERTRAHLATRQAC